MAVVLAAFDEHLRRARGVCAGTRRNYARFVGAFLQVVFPDGRVDVGQICVLDVIDFVGVATRRYQPATVIDLHSRKVVGYAVADHLRTSLIIEALAAALLTRRPPAGVVFH
ncbi:MAG: hypothetical protein LC700_01870, partial [Actinobacteria bacterium]|nr:hypothetical protein [Actinomycetota bacterium]